MNELNVPPLLDLTLLDRYLADEGTPAERAQVEQWLAANPLHEQRLQTLQALGDSHGVARAEALNVDRAWSQVAQARESFVRRRMRSSTVDGNREVEVGGRRTSSWGVLQARTLRWKGWYTLAGFAMGIAVLIAGLTVRDIHIFGGAGASEPAYTTYATANGQRATITLPDGNTVALNAATRLEVPTNYGAGNHALRLPVGEALFTVTHHTRSPFIVMAGSAPIRVLGTIFAIRHYHTDPRTTVAVQEGKVAVGTAVVGTQSVLAIGRTGALQWSTADASHFSFASGILTLHGMTLRDAIPELDRWYDADIRIRDSTLANQKIGGKFAAGSLADLTAILEWTFQARVVRDGRVLTLIPRY